MEMRCMSFSFIGGKTLRMYSSITDLPVQKGIIYS